MSDCLFCKIISKEIPSTVVYEDDSVFAFLDIRPVNKGHTLVVPKEHHMNLFDTPDDILGKMISTVKKVGNAVQNAVKADGVNLGMNNGGAAGQVIFHAHMHIIHRLPDDGFKHWHGKEFGNDEMEDIAERIRGVL